MTSAPLPDRSFDAASTGAREIVDATLSTPVGTCECGEPIYRKHRSGVPPKRCIACRELMGATGSKRGPRASEHEARVRGVAHDGPIIQLRAIMRALPLDQRPGGVPIAVTCAAVGLAHAVGIPEGEAEHIIEAMQVLYVQGESGVDMRRRMNSNAFGRTAAAAPLTPRGGPWDFLIEAQP